MEIEVISGLNITKTNLSFFADKNDILIKNIFGNLEEIQILNGDIKLNLENGVKLNSNFISKLNFDEKILNNYSKYFSKYDFIKNLKEINAELNNNFYINFDDTYKVQDYNYSLSGLVKKSKLKFTTPIKKNEFLNKEIKVKFFSDLKTQVAFKSTGIDFKTEGVYSLNNLDFLKLKIENNFNKVLI